MKLLDKVAFDYIKEARNNFQDCEIASYLNKQGYLRPSGTPLTEKEISAHAIKYGLYKKKMHEAPKDKKQKEIKTFSTEELSWIISSNVPRSLKVKIVELFL